MGTRALPRVLVFGAGGQLGTQLCRCLNDCFTLTVGDYRLVQKGFNLLDLKSIGATIDELQPNIIINAAAYSRVDSAESNESEAYAVNSTALSTLGAHAKKVGAFLVHFSSDYVYDGLLKRPYHETDVASPLNVYGQSKLEGELALIDSGCDYFIFRTSWVYSEYGDNFLKSILSLAQSETTISVIEDQFGVPTSAALLARVTRGCLKKVLLTADNFSGVYNVVPEGKTNWYEYARFIIYEARNLGLPIKVSDESLLGVSSKDYSSKARRPKNSCLDTTKIRDTFGLELPHWKYDVVNVLKRLV